MSYGLGARHPCARDSPPRRAAAGVVVSRVVKDCFASSRSTPARSDTSGIKTGSRRMINPACHASSSRTIPCASKADILGKFWPGRPLPLAPAKATAVPEATVNDTSSMAVTRLSARPRTLCRPQRMHKRMADAATCEPVFGHSDPPGSEPPGSTPACQPSGKRAGVAHVHGHALIELDSRGQAETPDGRTTDGPSG